MPISLPALKATLEICVAEIFFNNWFSHSQFINKLHASEAMRYKCHSFNKSLKRHSFHKDF